jgi:hypothetical protein
MMEKTAVTRGDLVKNFPNSFSHASLIDHFSYEYVKVFGQNAEKNCIQNLVNTFLQVWKVLKNKHRLYTTPRGQHWLNKKLVNPAMKVNKYRSYQYRIRLNRK